MTLDSTGLLLDRKAMRRVRDSFFVSSTVNTCRFTLGTPTMSDDKSFYGTILALFALMTGNPIIALIIFFLAVV